MRKFSDNEQQIIRKLVTNARYSDSYILANIFYDLFYQNSVEYTTGDTVLVFYRDIENVDIKDISHVFAQIVEISFLIIYLRNNRYIYEYYHDEQNSQKIKIGGCFQKVWKQIDVPLSDEIVKKTLTDSSKSIVFVTEELKSLVDNDFKTDEQIRFEKQLQDTDNKHKETMRNTRWALGFSFAGLLAALILPLCTKTKLAEIEYIKQEIRDSKTVIPSVIETKITNDTIKVDVVKPTQIKGNSNDTSE